MANPKHADAAVNEMLYMYEQAELGEPSGVMSRPQAPDFVSYWSDDSAESAAQNKEEPPEPVVLNDEQLVFDETFQSYADTLYESLRPKHRRTGIEYNRRQFRGIDSVKPGEIIPDSSSPEERATWLRDHYSWFNNNVTTMTIDYVRMKHVEHEVLRAFVAGLDMYDATENTKGTIGRVAKATVFDAANLVGLNLLAKGAVSYGSKHLVKSKLKDILARTMNSKNYNRNFNLLTGVVEGAGYGGAFMGYEEAIRAREGDREFDISKPLTGVGFGSAFGLALGGGMVLGQKLYKYLKDKKIQVDEAAAPQPEVLE